MPRRKKEKLTLNFVNSAAMIKVLEDYENRDIFDRSSIERIVLCVRSCESIANKELRKGLVFDVLKSFSEMVELAEANVRKPLFDEVPSNHPYSVLTRAKEVLSRVGRSSEVNR